MISTFDMITKSVTSQTYTTQLSIYQSSADQPVGMGLTLRQVGFSPLPKRLIWGTPLATTILYHS